jgi:hypothetical protein
VEPVVEVTSTFLATVVLQVLEQVRHIAVVQEALLRLVVVKMLCITQQPAAVAVVCLLETMEKQLVMVEVETVELAVSTLQVMV